MGKKLDILGKKFNRWLVVSEHGTINNKLYYNCQCDCGNKKVIVATSIKNGYTKSCGCFKLEKSRLEYGESNFNRLFESYKHECKRRKKNREFLLTKDDFRKLTKQTCYYCNCVPNSILNSKLSNGPYIYNGIDRKDNSIGYILTNCVPCCTDCNRMKNDYKFEDFKSRIEKVYINLFLKEK